MAAWAIGGLFCLAGATAAQAAVSDRLCNPASASASSRYPSTDLLRAVAANTENSLARRGASDRLPDINATLDPTAESAAPPSPAVVAEYCIAAGELMRVSPLGSQLQAQSYLLGGFRTARAAGLQGSASVAAYRLGLVSLSGSTVSGTRGARGAFRGGASSAAHDAGRSAGGDPCDLLLSAAALASTNLTLSLTSLACSAEQARLAGDARTAALADLRLARLQLALAEANSDLAPAFRTQAAQAARAGLEAARGIDDPALRAEVLGRLASAMLDARASSATDLRAVVASMRRAQPDSPAAGAFASAIEARLAFEAGDAAEARRLIGTAMLLESQRDLPARLPEWRLLLADFDPGQREAHVLAAYASLEAVRPLLPRVDPLTEESAFSLYMRRIFQSAVDVELAGAQGAQAASRVRGAQEIIEAYRQAELQSVFGSECIPPRDALRAESLAPGEVLLYPILLPDRLELLYVAGGAGGASFTRLAPNRTVDRQAVARLVETMVLSLSYDEDERWRAASRQLYDLLIKPIEAELTPGAILAVVPDGPLRSLPFAALLDGDSHYLIERARVSVVPSLAYSQPGSIDARQRNQLVAASLELEVHLPSGDFEKLNGTGNEARAAAVIDGKRIERSWVIENFRKADLIQALTREQVDVLHLATHASFNGRSDRAFIVANGEVILLSELRQILTQNRARGDELDLLVLSACETAVGDDEASMGLAGAAVQAGARTAIASLWPVNDAGTLQLMTSFYDRYREGRSKSEALREAQIAMIRGGGETADPNIWAAFTLLGAWR